MKRFSVLTVRAPRQQYKFLDVGAEELRGTFAYPAQSEQLLLYHDDARGHRTSRPERPFYSARYLLPQVELPPHQGMKMLLQLTT